jgi:L-Ala-D/L-Glu epimerase / N-acetyl-D-glutamate racemase
MKITVIETWRVDAKLAEPYTIAYETFDSVSNIFLRIETDSGIHGYGCGAPDLSVTGETPEMVLDASDSIIIPAVKGADPLRMAYIWEPINSLKRTHPATAAMLDMALWDILGKVSGLPVYTLLGGYRDSIPTSITIGIMSLKDTVAKALEWVEKDFKILKIKGGANVEEDIQRMIKVREAVGHNIELCIDANQGYRVQDAIKFAKETNAANIAFIEQPTAKKEPLLLGNVRDGQSIPVMADESLMNVKDAQFLCSRQLVDMLNIKLMKVGGISEAVKINAIAQANGQTVMVGCMDESALAIAAGLHLSLALPNIKYADLDGHLDFIDDPAHGSVILKEGMLYPTNLPGIGATIPF